MTGKGNQRDQNNNEKEQHEERDQNNNKKEKHEERDQNNNEKEQQEALRVARGLEGERPEED